MKKFLSIVAFFLIYNNFILANDYKKINEVAKKIYVQLKNNCPSEELECLNLSEKEINDLQNMLNIKLAVLEKNALRSRLMKITKYSSTFILSIFWIYLPLIQFLKDCHDDECNHELLNREVYAVLSCLGISLFNVSYAAINYKELTSIIKDMPENSSNIINKLLSDNQIENNYPDWFKEVVQELKNTIFLL